MACPSEGDRDNCQDYHESEPEVPVHGYVRAIENDDSSVAPEIWKQLEDVEIATEEDVKRPIWLAGIRFDGD